jgi:acyl-CoA thioester hydrolase
MSQTITISHTSTVRVRYADTDKMGIVYNGNYLTYFEIGRTELLRAIALPYSELEKQGCLLPVSEAKIQYKTPAVYDDILEITAIFRYAAHSATLTIDYTITRGTECIAEGYTIHPFLNATTRRPMRPPKIFTDTISQQSHKE